MLTILNRLMFAKNRLMQMQIFAHRYYSNAMVHTQWKNSISTSDQNVHGIHYKL